MSIAKIDNVGGGSSYSSKYYTLSTVSTSGSDAKLRVTIYDVQTWNVIDTVDILFTSANYNDGNIKVTYGSLKWKLEFLKKGMFSNQGIKNAGFSVDWSYQTSVGHQYVF